MDFKEWMGLIDTSGNGRVTKKELKAYYTNYVKDVIHGCKVCDEINTLMMAKCSSCLVEKEVGTVCPRCFYA